MRTNENARRSSTNYLPHYLCIEGPLKKIVLVHCFLIVAIFLFYNKSQAENSVRHDDKKITSNKNIDQRDTENKEYQIVLKNTRIDQESGSKYTDIYFIVKGVEYLVDSDTWINGDWKEYRNKGKKIMGCSVGKKGSMAGYNEFWIEKSGKFLVIKSYYIGGNHQVENSKIITKIKVGS